MNPGSDNKKMKKWHIAWHVDATGWQCVEAETEEEARNIAENEFFPMTENTEIGDAVDIVDIRCTEEGEECNHDW